MTWYTGDPVFDTILAIGLAFGVLVVLIGFVMQSPYGRFASEGKAAFNLNPKLGWWLMELPATVSFVVFFIWNWSSAGAAAFVMGAIWLIHYGNRGWFFPLSIRVAPGRRSTFNVSVMLAGMFVVSIHGYLNATWFTALGGFTEQWLSDPRFIIGVIVYAIGLALIVHSEHVVRNLRPRDPDQGTTEYKIPHGGGFRLVSNPQYLGELIAWAGFTIFTWGLPGVMIFLISAGNLVPRAFATHKWYQEKFPDYPAERKALIPYVI